MALRVLQRVWVLRMGNNASAATAISNTAIANQIKDAISDDCVVIFSKSTCSYCKMAKKLFQEMNVNYKAIELDRYENGSQFQDILHQMTGSRTVPRIFINGNFVGGATDTQQLHREGKLLPLVHQCHIQRERNSVHSKLDIGKLVYQTKKVKRDLDNTKIRRWSAGNRHWAQIKQSLERKKLNSA